MTIKYQGYSVRHSEDSAGCAALAAPPLGGRTLIPTVCAYYRYRNSNAVGHPWADMPLFSPLKTTDMLRPPRDLHPGYNSLE